MKTHEQNTQKHTPGPWHVDGNYIHGPNGKRFLAVAGDGEGLTNARIISAAPELLQAAIWHRDMLDLGDVAFYEKHRFNVCEVMPRTRAAIAKATGEGNK